MTVEPLNKGYFGASHVVIFRLVLWERYFEECLLQKGRPFLEGSAFI